MDNLDEREPGSEERVEPSIEREWEPNGFERREERPAIEPFDPYFGRRPKEAFAWF